jgi:phosphoribosylglycinamide formyltransferase-1
MRKSIAVFASGRGSNFNVIAKNVASGAIKARLALLLCDQPKAGVIKKANRAKVKVVLIRRENFSSKAEFEGEIIKSLKREKIDLIVLAGFMRILSASFVRRYKGRIVNIHPSLLPSFKGEHGIKDAFAYGVKITGVTVHFVDEEMDHGPVILQKEVIIGKNDTLRTLEEKIHKVEHQIYPEAIKLFIAGRLKLSGRKVRVA